MITANNCSHIRASINYVKTVRASDEPGQIYSGPDYDLYVIDVEHGPSEPFLMWFHQTNEYELCRIGTSSEFIDLGGAKSPATGKVIDLTFDEFFPQWLECATSVAKANIARAAREATANLPWA